MKRNIWLFSLIGCAVFSQPILAGLMIYEISGIGSGTIGSQVFTAANFSFFLQEDTADIFHLTEFQGMSVSIFVTGNSTATLSVEGLPAATINQSVVAFVSQTGSEGIGLSGIEDGDLITILEPGLGFDTYDLKTPFGPIDSDQPMNQFVDIASSHGDISFTSMPSISFRAISVPEPSSALCIGVLVGALCFVQRLRDWRTSVPNH